MTATTGATVERRGELAEWYFTWAPCAQDANVKCFGSSTCHISSIAISQHASSCWVIPFHLSPIVVFFLRAALHSAIHLSVNWVSQSCSRSHQHNLSPDSFLCPTWFMASIEFWLTISQAFNVSVSAFRVLWIFFASFPCKWKVTLSADGKALSKWFLKSFVIWQMSVWLTSMAMNSFQGEAWENLIQESSSKKHFGMYMYSVQESS